MWRADDIASAEILMLELFGARQLARIDYIAFSSETAEMAGYQVVYRPDPDAGTNKDRHCELIPHRASSAKELAQNFCRAFREHSSDIHVARIAKKTVGEFRQRIVQR